MKNSSPNFRPQTLALACAVALSTAYVPQLAVAQVALEEVLVTARKRVESLHDVPVTMSAFGQEELERSGVTSLTDIARLVPNMQINSALSSPEQAKMIAAGNIDSANLTKDNYVSFGMLNISLMQMAQSIDYLYRTGSLDHELWKTL